MFSAREHAPSSPVRRVGVRVFIPPANLHLTLCKRPRQRPDKVTILHNVKTDMDTTKDPLPLPPMPCSDMAGGPPIDWKKRHDDLLKHVTALGAAASILRDNHKNTPHCEMPRTCGGCHFWTGVIEACRDLETGDETTIRKAHAIVIGSHNKSSSADGK